VGGGGVRAGVPSRSRTPTGASNTCKPTNTRAGDLLTIAGWTLQALARAFATLFIAGYTSAVRKT
jgi:hypothetical protein